MKKPKQKKVFKPVQKPVQETKEERKTRMLEMCKHWT